MGVSEGLDLDSGARTEDRVCDGLSCEIDELTTASCDSCANLPLLTHVGMAKIHLVDTCAHDQTWLPAIGGSGAVIGIVRAHRVPTSGVLAVYAARHGFSKHSRELRKRGPGELGLSVLHALRVSSERAMPPISGRPSSRSTSSALQLLATQVGHSQLSGFQACGATICPVTFYLPLLLPPGEPWTLASEVMQLAMTLLSSIVSLGSGSCCTCCCCFAYFSHHHHHHHLHRHATAAMATATMAMASTISGP